MTLEKNDLPRWDLTNVYPSLDSAEFKAANEEFVRMVDDLDQFIAANKIDPSQAPSYDHPKALAGIIGAFIDKINAAARLGNTITAYINSFVSTDSYNTEAQKAMSRVEQVDVRLEQQEGTLFRGWIGRLGDRIEELIELNETAKAHAFYLRETVEQSRYLMSSAEEKLAAELALSGIVAWQKLQRTITSQLKWDVENLEGQVEKLPMTVIINLRTHKDEVMRRRGYEAEQAAWGSVENQLAACLNGVKGTQNTLYSRRGRQDFVHDSMDQARIDRETLEAMLEGVKGSLPTFRRYFKAKARRLGKDSLPWWDLFAPTGKAARKYSYAEAQAFVLENFARFSPRLADFAKRSFDNNWIDVGPRDGKRAGAFCMDLPGVDESRVLMNFDGGLDGIFTLAHELGHAFHTDCQVGNTMLQNITPMTLAETASIMCETVVTNAVIEKAADADEELAILETSLISDSQVVVDIYSRYLFETEVFERRVEAELSAREVNELMEWAQVQAYGDGLDESYLQKAMWTWKPHYYRPALSFYNYPYTFGLLFGTGLYAIYQARGDDFVPDYIGLLASTGMGKAADLAARFDIDLRSPEFWEGSLRVIGERIERYERL